MVHGDGLVIGPGMENRESGIVERRAAHVLAKFAEKPL
ncbi:hypothetical protein LG3211_4150 [Lysobacter gummosus]|nr:hypothetical protein LG3211_4150 [Lysobacter gummosus]